MVLTVAIFGCTYGCHIWQLCEIAKYGSFVKLPDMAVYAVARYGSFVQLPNMATIAELPQMATMVKLPPIAKFAFANNGKNMEINYYYDFQ